MQFNERAVILILAAVQFFNIVDFMMVIPLGPDFADALGIGIKHLGVIAASYTASAAVSGIVCGFFLDRFDRKKALIFCVAGLSVGTLMGGFSFNLTSLLVSRIVAGAFGGPASSLVQAIIADVIPQERRGVVLSKVMMAFSVASIAGVPLSLEIARFGGWHMPFFFVAAATLLIAILAWKMLPSFTQHLNKVQKTPLTFLLRRPILSSYTTYAILMISGFFLFPNIASFLQKNLLFPRDEVSLLYFAGGLASLLTMRFVGKAVDKFGSLPVYAIGSVGFILTTLGAFYAFPPIINPYAMFILMMASGSARNISMQTFSSKIPNPQERAGYMSVQTAVQHIAISIAGALSTQLLDSSTPDQLIGMDHVALSSVACSIISLAILAWMILRPRDSAISPQVH